MNVLLLILVWNFMKIANSVTCNTINKEEIKCTCRSSVFLPWKSKTDDASTLKNKTNECTGDVSIECHQNNVFSSSYTTKQNYFKLICFQNIWKTNITCNSSIKDILEEIEDSMKSFNITYHFHLAKDIEITCNINPSSLAFYNFSEAIHLDLSGNDLMYLPENRFESFKNIENLKLFNNKMENISEDALSGLTKLLSVTLSYNRLTQLPEKLFADNTELRNVMIDFNQLKELSQDLFRSLKQLKHVSLINNKLTNLPANLFSNNIKLTFLDVSHNLLQNIHYTTFPNTIELQYLNLNNNNLSQLNLSFINDPPVITIENLSTFMNITEDFLVRYSKSFNSYIPIDIIKSKSNNFFVKTNKLIHLDISHNQFAKLSNSIFDSSKAINYIKSNFNKGIKYLEGSNILFSLQSLTMVQCNILKISENYFRRYEDDYIELRELILSKNKISTIYIKTFWRFLKLQTLLLDHNNLTTLSDGCLKDLKELKHLDLSFNKLITLSVEVFNLESLIRLNLQFNNIHGFNNSSFTNYKLITSIQNLNLSNNCLNSGSMEYILDRSKSDFKIVDLSYNALENVPSLTYDFVSYNLRYNGIRTLNMKNSYQETKPRFSRNIKNILLCPNPLEYMCVNGSCEAISDTSLRILSIKNADISIEICKEEMWAIKEYYFQDMTSCPFHLKCPMNFYKSLICNDKNNCSEEYLSFVRCKITEDCPSACTCYQRVVLQQIIVDCNNAGLSSLPSIAPKDTRILYLQNNNLENLDSLKAPVWNDLIEIYLDNNSISFLNKLTLPSALQKLSLRHNKIERINEDTQRLFTRREVYLGKNPWICDCSTVSFKAFLNFPNRIADIKDITCKNGNTPIIDISNQILCPEKVLTHLPIWASLAIILPLFIGVILILYYRNKQIVVAYIYSRFPVLFTFIYMENEVEEDKHFDAFISYSTSDRDIVMRLIEELEEKDPNFCLCIHERDWIPGNPICSNIANSVSNSRRTIIILSEQFLNSIWFPVELHSAYYKMLEDKVNRIIFILRGQLPPMNTLDKDLQVLLKTKTYLVWGERWFWEKLRLALPHKDHPIRKGKSILNEDEFL